MTRVVMPIHGEAGHYGASFPNFPGATTGADDLDTLYGKAAEMLAFHVGGMAEDGEPVPETRSLDALREGTIFGQDSRDAIVSLIEVGLPGRAVRVNISMEESLLKRVDRAAAAAGESRSGSQGAPERCLGPIRALG